MLILTRDVHALYNISGSLCAVCFAGSVLVAQVDDVHDRGSGERGGGAAGGAVLTEEQGRSGEWTQAGGRG